MPLLNLSKANYSFSVAGVEYAIIDLAILLTLNAPPQLQVRAVPKKFIDKKVVSTSNAELFWSIVAKADSVLGKPEVSLSISNLGEDIPMDFNASGWVLADIGLSASAAADFPAAIDFVIQHPIVLLSKYPVSLGPTKDRVDLDKVTGSSYLELVKGVLKAYSSKLTDSAKKQPTYHLFEEGIGKLDEYLTCEGCDVSKLTGLFPWADSENLIGGFKDYILACAVTGVSGASLYSFFAQSIASELSLGLYNDPSDLSASKMILKPRAPFLEDGCAMINSSMTVNIRNSAGDWLSPSGVYTNAYSLRLPDFNHPSYNGQSMQDPMFVSVVAKDGGTQIVPVKIPNWVNSMIGHVSPRVYNTIHSVLNPQTLNFDRDDHVNSVKKILTQYFLDMYRQAKNITITRLFSVYDDSGGHLLVPGISCSMSGGNGKGLLFLITSVQHTFTINDNQAITTISGNYVRGSQFSVEVEGAEPSNLITDGFSSSTNYIWG